MDRDEQVRVHAAGLLHTHMQRHEVVVVARQVGAHERLAVDQRLQAPGDAQHHVFFAQAAAADGARIFAAMTRIQRDGQHALLAAARGGGRRLGRRRQRRGRLLALHAGRFGRISAGCRIALDVFQDACQRVVRVGPAFVQDRHQGVLSDLGVQIQHQPVLVVGHGLEREHLGRHGLLQVEHQPHDVRAVLRHAQALDIGVVRADLRDQVVQGRADGQPFDVHHQAVGIFKRELFGLELAVEFEGDPGVFVCRPGRAAWPRR
ncbi:hypothetical protein G6F68_013283 [Rhizopus microsporus]|nr:hypothetical protein G6F68_013283 [Rhizopus microsporus]